MIGLSLLGAAAASPFLVYGQDLPDIEPLIAQADAGTAPAALPAHVSQAFIAMQDRDFLRHEGYDAGAIARASGQTIVDRGNPTGGATLTQQLVKNSLLRDEQRSVRRKVREVLLARRLERSLDKDQILGLYLAHTYFGGDAFGIEAAARRYFGRSASTLTVAQAAYLASLVNAPNDLRVDRAANRGRALAARQVALARMERAGFLTPDSRRSAEREPIW